MEIERLSDIDIFSIYQLLPFTELRYSSNLFFTSGNIVSAVVVSENNNI